MFSYKTLLNIIRKESVTIFYLRNRSDTWASFNLTILITSLCWLIIDRKTLVGASKIIYFYEITDEYIKWITQKHIFLESDQLGKNIDEANNENKYCA